MSVLANFVTVTKFKEEEFSTWSVTELTDLCGAVSTTIVPRTVKAREMVGRRGVTTAADIQFINALITKINSGRRYKPGNGESSAWSSGNRYETTVEACATHRLDGTTDVHRQDISYYEGKNHEGEEFLFSILSVLVYRDGKVVTQANLASWTTQYLRSQIIDVSYADNLASLLDAILAADPIWKGKNLQEKLQTTGNMWQLFLRQMIRRMDLADYFYIYHFICSKLLKLVDHTASKVKSGLKGLKVEDHLSFYSVDMTSPPIVAAAMAKIKKIQSLVGVKNIPIIRKSIPLDAMVPDKANLKSAMQAVSTSVAWRGGDSSAMGLLTFGWGWTVQTSAVAKRVSLAAAVINNLLLTIDDIDIQMPSTGDFVLLHTTIDTFIKNNAVLTPEQKQKKTVRFMIGTNGTSSIDKNLRRMLVTSRRPGAHLFAWLSDVYAAVNKDKVSELYAAVNDFSNMYDKDFTIWRPILTEYWWKTERKLVAKSFQVDNWVSDERDYFIYSYGLNSEFQGFVSTVKLGLSPVAVTPYKFEIGNKLVPGTVQKCDLKLHATSEAWYGSVALANAVRNSAWLTGTRKVTNLISGVVPASASVMWRYEVMEHDKTVTSKWSEDFHDEVGWQPVTTSEGISFTIGKVVEEKEPQVDKTPVEQPNKEDPSNSSNSSSMSDYDRARLEYGHTAWITDSDTRDFSQKCFVLADILNKGTQVPGMVNEVGDFLEDYRNWEEDNGSIGSYATRLAEFKLDRELSRPIMDDASILQLYEIVMTTYDSSESHKPPEPSKKEEDSIEKVKSVANAENHFG